MTFWPWKWYASRINVKEPSGSQVIHYVTNGRTDRQKQRLLPLSYGRGHNKIINWNNASFSQQDFLYLLEGIFVCNVID